LAARRLGHLPHARSSAPCSYLNGGSASGTLSLVPFLQGLRESGFVEGRNVNIEYRWADGRYDRLPAQLTDLTQRKVDVIVFDGFVNDEKLVQQICASPIPIVFNWGGDPVRLGLVASMNRPGGNVTGINTFTGVLSGKLLGLLHEVVPKAATIAALFGGGAFPALGDARDAAAALGQKLLVLNARTVEEIDAQFASLDQKPADAMLVITSPFFLTQAEQITALAARHRIPAIYVRREFAEAGGLMSYGYDVADGYRLLGGYAGRILKGEKAGDLPVFQPTKFELVINLKTAKALGLTIPETLLATADQVIE
jgi:putative tryptophan/tyrosine transport system substrate-binding protein